MTNSTKLKDLMVQAFNLDELFDICYRLDLPYDNLPHDTVPTLVRELITYLTRRNELYNLLEILKQIRPNFSWEEFQERKDIPVVVLAMNRDEAVELFQEAIFQQSPFPTTNNDLEKFKHLRETLTDYDLAKLSDQYYDNREEWVPYNQKYVDNKEPIKRLVENIFQVFNQSLSPHSPLFFPVFHSNNFFSENPNEQLETWLHMRERGSILIVDTVSLYHPKIRYFLRQSELSSSQKTAMLAISPVSFHWIETNRLIELEISTLLNIAFAKYSDKYEKNYELGVMDLRSLKRALMSVLTEVSDRILKYEPNPKSRERFLNAVDTSKRGFGRIITGR